jgi:DNA-binding beta-propeller fold protein YncE
LVPDLVRLEKKYARQLVVVGIHTPKFDQEKNSESIRKAMRRYEMAHPVINDANRKIGMTYKVIGWPTVFLIDPEGYLVGVWPLDEHPYGYLDRAISQLIRIHRARHTLNEKPLHFEAENARKRGDSPLYFPGKVLADAKGKRLFIADSTNHRIVITDLAGKKIAIAGTGQPGKTDGSFERANFNDPQGLALRGDLLYVADRKNNLIRALDLKTQEVKTVAGTGLQGKALRSGGPARRVGLNSPWDLLLRGNLLYIAMAGHHQIWILDLGKNRLFPFAGSGQEDIIDGGRLTACFAQPSGLAADDSTLYVADSEVSAIRAVPLDGQGPVSTLVGAGLFQFGDVDGQGNKVRLQHALGVVYHEGKLYVADTYNNKIKVLDPATRSCTTFVAGKRNQPLFDEPGGISYARGKLYVADTNAHRIRVVDLETKEVSTLKLQGVQVPKTAAQRPLKSAKE